MIKKEWLVLFLLLFVTLIWGTTFIVVKDVTTLIKPYSFNFIRFLIAAFWIGILYQIFSTKRKNKKTPFTSSKKDLIQYGVFLGFILFLGFLSLTFGLQYTSSSNAGFITGLNVAFTPLLLMIFSKFKPPFQTIIGICASIVGLYFLTLKGSTGINKGDLLVLLCAVAFAIHIILTSHFVVKFDPLALTFVQLLTVSIFSFICAIFTEDIRFVFHQSLWTNSKFLFALFITSFFATALAYFIQTYAQTILSPTRVAMTFIMEPVFAALAGVLVAGEIITKVGYLGCFFIFFGMILVEWPSKPKECTDTPSLKTVNE